MLSRPALCKTLLVLLLSLLLLLLLSLSLLLIVVLLLQMAGKKTLLYETKLHCWISTISGLYKIVFDDFIIVHYAICNLAEPHVIILTQSKFAI